MARLTLKIYLMLPVEERYWTVPVSYNLWIYMDVGALLLLIFFIFSFIYRSKEVREDVTAEWCAISHADDYLYPGTEPMRPQSSYSSVLFK